MGSTAGNPTRVSKSARSADLTLVSRGVSQPNEGERFTSSNHGFNSESIRISKPYNSEKAWN